MLFRVAMSSAKLASEATCSAYRGACGVIGEYSIARNLVACRYEMTLSTSAACEGDGFCMNSASLLAAKAISRRAVATRYVIDPTRY